MNLLKSGFVIHDTIRIQDSFCTAQNEPFWSQDLWSRNKAMYSQNKSMFLQISYTIPASLVKRSQYVTNGVTWCSGQTADDWSSWEDLSRRWRQSLLRWKLKWLAAKLIRFESRRQTWIQFSKIRACLIRPEWSEDQQTDPGWTESVCSSKARELGSIS